MRKEMPEVEIVGQHHLLNGHEFEQTWGDSEGQGNLMCCHPQDRKELDTSEQQQQSFDNQMSLVFTKISFYSQFVPIRVPCKLYTLYAVVMLEIFLHIMTFYGLERDM